ncbi:MAG: peptidoglycan DD-metalloendopeptidase family protein [Peptococcaceae bacterium]|nr:peptidoglycan DD-metalloendopeptidase family protein [Peptococcaceae bacterium]
MASRIRGYMNKQRLRAVVYFESLSYRINNIKFSQVMKSRGFLLATYLVVMLGLAGLWWWNSPYRLGNNPINLPDYPPVTQIPTPGVIVDDEPSAETTGGTQEPNLPVAEKPAPEEEPALPVLSLTTPVDKLKRPVEGAITAPFGFKWSNTYQDYRWRHGVGIASTQGTPVVAAIAGRVLSVVEQDPEWGCKVIIDHGNSWKSVYANITKVSVKVGQKIAEGQQIGQVGSNPPAMSADSPQLYFALYEREESVDPTSMFK